MPSPGSSSTTRTTDRRKLGSPSSGVATSSRPARISSTYPFSLTGAGTSRREDASRLSRAVPRLTRAEAEASARTLQGCMEAARPAAAPASHRPRRRPGLPRPIPPSTWPGCGWRIARLSRRLRRHELAGLTPTSSPALATVERAGPLRLGDLAAAEGIAPSTLTRLVTALEERGYVDSPPGPGDARASTLAIAPAGRAVLERIRQESTTVLADSLRTLHRRAGRRARGGPARAGAAGRRGPARPRSR